MAVDAKLVKTLREMTGAGILECKKALEETNGNLEEAVELLRKRGIAKAAKKAGRETKEGIIHAYIHAGGRVGVLL
ncbi:MAG TPA: elongation factor Ts, partial [Persephonella sp.]|nr:elongation factor Ts [Persephonella sp.]